MASFDCGHSLMKDGEFERAKSFTAQTRGSRERGKENKPNASVAHTEEEMKLLYDKELFCLTPSLRPLTTQQQDHFSLTEMQRLTGLFFLTYSYFLRVIFESQSNLAVLKPCTLLYDSQ